MIGKFKSLGLALVAVMALSAVVASAASAVEFHSESATVILTASGSSEQVITYSGTSQLKCPANTTTLAAALSGTTSPELTAFVTYPTSANCRGPLGLPTHVLMNSCHYLFTASGSTHIRCETVGDSIEIAITTGNGESFCAYHIPEQTPTTPTITYTNSGTGTTREATVTSAVSGIHGTRTGSALCGAASSTTGTYSGSITMTGENAEGHHVGFWVE